MRKYEPRTKPGIDSKFSCHTHKCQPFLGFSQSKSLDLGLTAYAGGQRLLEAVFEQSGGINSRAEGPSQDLSRDKSNQNAVSTICTLE